MKKLSFRALLALCLTLALAGGALSVFSLAQGDLPTVLYDHDQGKFIISEMPFKDDDGHTYPDLFTGFKDLMPGDSVTQSITVDARGIDDGTVYIRLRTDDDPATSGATDAELTAYEKLLADGNVSLLISQDGKPIAQQSLKNGILLGKFRKNTKPIDLDVTLSISTAAGNELQGLQAGIGWVFTAEYYPDPSRPVGPTRVSGDHFAYIIGYPDGLVHPEGSITRAETVTIFFRMLTDELREDAWSQVNPYYDVRPESWYNNAISTMCNYGILKGYPDGNFQPNANITRAEFAALAVRFFEGEGEAGEDDAFPDIKRHWANAEINLAYAKGLIEGYPDGTFRPDQEITRAEAMTIVNRVLERHPHKEHLLEDMIVWPDNMDETAWYYEAVQEATNSHTFQMKRDDQDQPYEIWQELLPVRDWVALEKQWSEHNSAKNPGEVVSSKDNSIFKN